MHIISTVNFKFGAKFGTFYMPIPSFEKANTLPSTDVLRLLRDRVRFERRRLGYSQTQFAVLCGVPLRTFKRFELGGCDSIEVLIKITQGFGRGPGFDMLFPAQPFSLQPRGMEVALQSIRSKLDAIEIQ
jgi:hypothetical protein